MPQANQFIDSHGRVLVLQDVPPAAIGRTYRRQFVEAVRKRASERMLVQRAISKEEWAVPWWDVMVSALRSKKVTRLEQYLLVQLWTGTLPTESQWQLWGYTCDGMCKAGCMVVDSPWHRVAGCIRTTSTLGKLRKPWELSSTFGKYKEWLIPVDPAAGEDMLPQTTKGGGAFGFNGGRHCAL